MADKPEARSVQWSCTVCLRTDGPFAPSGRCVPCEAAVDIPTAAEAGTLRQIGEVATLVGLSLRTVRHYEDSGLVLPAARTPGGFRLYDGQAIDRLRLIMKMKPLGFTLEEMRILIETRSRLDSGDVSDDEAEDLRDRLAMFTTAAADKVIQLAEQLGIAESFVAQLQDDVRRFGSPGPDARS
jgi:DNA-binding transcriptional MerR regulator